MIPLRTFLLLGAGLLAAAARAETEDDADETKTRPNRQELWVPANKVGTVLKDYPRAVLMSRAQYETLLREASPKEPLPDAPPREAALVSAQYQGKVEGKVLTVTGELVAQVLAAEWAQVPLQFGTLSLAEVKVDGEGALAPPPQPPASLAKPPPAPVAEPSTVLLLRGRGPHKISVRFASPIATTDAWHGATLGLPAAGANSLVVDFPPHTLAECAQPLRTETLPDATRVTVALPIDSCSVSLRWRSSGGGLVALPPSLSSKTIFTIDAEAIQARSDFIVSTATGTLPETLELTLAPDARLVEVTGSDIAGWTVEGQRATLRLPPGRGSRVEFSTVVQRPSIVAQAAAEIPLPLPDLVGAGRVEGEFSIYSGQGVAVRDLSTTPGVNALPPESGVVGRWRFVGPKVAPGIRVERLRPRFHADLDTLLDFQPEAIFLERTVTLHPEEGGVFNLLLTLPAGEEVLTVRTVSGAQAAQESSATPKPAAVEPDPLWRVEGAKLSLRWLADPLPGHPRTFQVKTRLEPKGWSAGVGRTVAALPIAGEAAPAAETFLFPVAEVKIEGAEKITGYVALRASENFRLETEAADTLEPRDGRTTPVTGAYAWFRRGDFDLKVRVTRRPSELLASLTGYALPLAGVLDLHAQIVWEFRYSGVRSVQIRVPEKQADLFYFDGPQIAERKLAGDTWTITFQKELTGRQVLSVTAQIPIAKTADDASRFSTTVPVIEPLHTQRSGGTWVIEANTDTEIQLTATGMNELDAPLAPPLEGYQPRHRVIGVFTWLGPKYELSLSGVRHAGAGVLTTVVDFMEIASVVSTSGIVRNEAHLLLRSAGAQFLDVSLPKDARLLSLLVDGDPSKPVEGRPGDVRVQLPARPDPSVHTDLIVMYEYVATPEWKTTGRSTLAPLRLPREVPVLKTKWQAFLPEGYYYSGATNNLAPDPPRWERPLLLAPGVLWDLKRAVGAMSVLGASGIADPRALAMRQNEAVDRLARLSGFGQVDDDGNGRMVVQEPFAAAGGGLVDDDGRKGIKSDELRSATFASRDFSDIAPILTEARRLYETGRYDLASKRCEQVLNLDPYNIDARKLQEQINKKKEEYAISGSNQARSNALWQTSKAWDKPVHRFPSEGFKIGGDINGAVISSGEAQAPTNGPAAATNLNVSGEEARRVGLLPMRLELPKVGEQMVVAGFGAPEPLEVRYSQLEHRSFWLWIGFFVGAVSYLVFGGRHPWWRTAWVVLWLTAIPLVISPAATMGCNLLLGGWLVMLVVARLARRFIFNHRVEKEALT